MAFNTEVGMSAADFVRLYDAEGPFELIDRERVPLSLNVFGPVYYANRIAQTTLTGDQRLTAGDILPGFDITVAQIFARMDTDT